ncbi:MAG: hypothetical protein E6K10_10625 [Methanobacteriota archaeon]|nr:MAG: hypothetical protein E6K10_10625 [Euryarchaeota archaeon]
MRRIRHARSLLPAALHCVLAPFALVHLQSADDWIPPADALWLAFSKRFGSTVFPQLHDSGYIECTTRRADGLARIAGVKIRILCTLGPASLVPSVIEGLDRHQVYLFRINLSHTPLEAVASTIEFVQQHSTTPICLDSEGPQIRCGLVDGEVVLDRGHRIRLTSGHVSSDHRSRQAGCHRRRRRLWPCPVQQGRIHRSKA